MRLRAVVLAAAVTCGSIAFAPAVAIASTTRASTTRASTTRPSTTRASTKAPIAVMIVHPSVVRQTAASVWPARGQAAYVLGSGRVHVGPHAHVASIASMAKVMTAYLVLRKYPVNANANGFTLTVTQRDVNDRSRRVRRDESTVPVARGERITERQAVAALLLPSANNVAIMLARKVSGTVGRFVSAMNSAAKRLGMTRTHYTDPSGYEASTTSTAVDQLRVAKAAMGIAFLRWMVNRTSFRIPVAGTIRNTDTLLRHDGFVGIKTGSHDAAGGCFMFRSRRVVNGRVLDLYGVVMGQYGSNGLLPAAFAATKKLVDRVAPRSAG